MAEIPDGLAARVTARDGDALGEITPADARRTSPHRRDRHHHAACQEQAGQESEREAAQQRRAGARAL